jgi:hypothetical protein
LDFKKTELILPEEIYAVMGDSLREKIEKLQYARVIMPLSALLEGEFFNTYIKTGILTYCYFCSFIVGREKKRNIALVFVFFFIPDASFFYWDRALIFSTGDVLMLSEGRAGVDDVFSLQNGMRPHSVYFWIALSF